MKLALCFVSIGTLVALLAGGAAIAQAELEIGMVYVAREEAPRQPLSLLDLPAEDNGLAGSLLGLKDTQTTGNFLKHSYALEQLVVPAGASLTDAFRERLAAGLRIFVADLEADDLQAIADLAPDALIFNIRARDDVLRNEACRANLLHLPPSRAMLADALAQYLAWKRWNRLVLVRGQHAEDGLYAESLERAAKRFGLKIVERKTWTAVAGARRTDSGHHTVQQEVPAFSRFGEHDLLLVADERDEFGEYLPYQTALPRPVGGTHGLMPTAWHRSQEQWGATQLQRRFSRIADRPMTERDYAGWMALRSIGEAVTNTGSTDTRLLRDYLLSDRFRLAGFKGVPLTFRDWNGQLRQPVLVVGPRMLVSVSPQQGFLHQRSELDTLGFDQPESGCRKF